MRLHWPEYFSEAAGLGLFMLSACAFTVLLEHPGAMPDFLMDTPVVRHALAGIAMGLTALAIVSSPLGKRSGGHLNPAMTLNFYLLGKVRGWDAAGYVTAQFAGGLSGVLIADLLLGLPVRHSAVRYAVTVPGSLGVAAAFSGELAISFIQMFAVLSFSNHRTLSRYTPYAAAALVATYITFESPLSGMSMNPARTIASAIPANEYTALWLYFAAPLIGMIGAGLVYRTWGKRVYCAKLHHHNQERCIFRCRFHEL
jgi:aquaporin Z